MEAAAKHSVDPVFDSSQVGRGVDGMVGAFADVAAEETVAVFVDWALPGRVRRGELYVDPRTVGEVGLTGHLAALVPGEGAAQHGRDPVEDLDHDGQDSIGVVAFGVSRPPPMSGGPVNTVEMAEWLLGTEDEVAFEVADLAAPGGNW